MPNLNTKNWFFIHVCVFFITKSKTKVAMVVVATTEGGDVENPFSLSLFFVLVVAGGAGSTYYYQSIITSCCFCFVIIVVVFFQ